jgi:pyrimidine deaminase RibD-like protein
VHVRRGQLLVNGSADGLVELTIEPPCHTDRTLSTMFVKEKVSSVIVSLVDPDGFIAVVEGDGHT